MQLNEQKWPFGLTYLTTLIKYGAHWYLDNQHFKKNYDHQRLIQNIRDKQQFARDDYKRECLRIDDLQTADDTYKKHLKLKRESLLKHAISAILSRKNRASCAPSIVNRLKIEEKMIENEGTIREINRYLKFPLDFSNRENRSEQLHGIILHNAFQLKNTSIADKSKHIESLLNTSKTMAETVRISEADEELKKIVNEVITILVSYE